MTINYIVEHYKTDGSGFDGSIPGYEKRQLEDLDKQALMQRMQETVEA